MISLTPQQQKLFTFIKEKIEASGIAPSYLEMQRFMGLASKSGIHRMLEDIEVKGRMRRLKGKARAMEIIEAKCPHCGREI